MKFSVPDMSCGHCTAAIEKAITSADPSAAVACDLEGRTVAVLSHLSGDEVTSAIKSAGYGSEQLAG